jgi:hypothetical protein
VTTRRPGLIVHTFLSVDRSETGAVQALKQLWEAVAELDMDSPIGRWPLDPADTTAADRDHVTVMAARQRVHGGSFYQAVAYRLHDVIGVSVLLAPNDDRIGWSELAASWTRVMPRQPAAAMHSVLVHLGLWRRPWGAVRWFTPADPPVPAGEAAMETVTWVRQGEDVLLGEVLAGDDGPRRIVALASPANELVLDALTWAGGAGLPPLTRYLLHAAKVRYQRTVLLESLADLRSAVSRTESGCEELRSLLDQQDPPVRELIKADRALAAVQTEEHGLIAALTDVRDMTETIRVARRNMAAARDSAGEETGDPLLGSRGGVFGTDDEIGAWVSDQLRAELTYLESALLKATALAGRAATVVEGWHQHRRETLTLVQTSVVGALLMALAAIQSFEYKVPLPGGLFAPAIALLTALALIVPGAISQWQGWDSIGPVQSRRYAAGGALIGGATGWLVAATGSQIAAGAPAPPVGSVVAAIAGALVGGLTPLAWSRLRRRRRSRPGVQIGCP